LSGSHQERCSRYQSTVSASPSTKGRDGSQPDERRTGEQLAEEIPDTDTCEKIATLSHIVLFFFIKSTIGTIQGQLHKAGKRLLLCGAREQPSRLISQSDFLKAVGKENVLPHVQAALARARQIHGDFGGIGPELALDLERRPL